MTNEMKEQEIIFPVDWTYRVIIESAKEEAINTILEMAEFKENGNCKYLIATGC